MTLEVGGLLLAAGAAAGFVDAVAGGGGLITVPVLLWTGLPPPLACGTHKLQAACGTTLAVLRYSQAGLVHWREVRLPVAVTFASAVAGTFAVTRIDNDLLRHLVPWMLLAIAIYALISPRLGLEKSRPRLSPFAFGLLGGLVLGFYDGFFGPGTGSFWTIACLTLAGMDLSRATGFTKVVNLTSNLASLSVFLTARQVQYDAALVMIAGQLVGARLGSGLVIRHGAPFIRVVFLIVVFALTIKLLWDRS